MAKRRRYRMAEAADGDRLHIGTEWNVDEIRHLLAIHPHASHSLECDRTEAAPHIKNGRSINRPAHQTRAV